MASLFEHPRSKFFFVQFRGTDGKVHRKSLKIEQGTTQARREALKEVAEITARELSRSTFNDASRWEAWVIGFLEMHYKGRDKTLIKYRSCWEKVHKFLIEQGIRYPAQVKYSLAEKYMRWRMADGAHHNTARLDLVLFSMVMKQAVRLEFAQGIHGIRYQGNGQAARVAGQNRKLIGFAYLHLFEIDQKPPAPADIRVDLARNLCLKNQRTKRPKFSDTMHYQGYAGDPLHFLLIETNTARYLLRGFDIDQFIVEANNRIRAHRSS